MALASPLCSPVLGGDDIEASMPLRLAIYPDIWLSGRQLPARPSPIRRKSLAHCALQVCRKTLSLASQAHAKSLSRWHQQGSL